MSRASGEFGIIKEILSPLTREMPGALGLTDDAALLRVEAGQELVVTKDAMVAGVHFLENEEPALIAKKLLRTNLSDLAAMGAHPVGYLLATAWTQACDEAWITEFARGLMEDQDIYDIGLLGGDTVKTLGPLTLSLTALGTVPAGKSLRRNSAKVGDLVFVSGSIGDAALGLQSILGKLTGLSAVDRNFLENRYHLPQPRTDLGPSLVDLAASCLDISDGLFADLGHICTESQVGMMINKGKIPLSDAATNALTQNPDCWQSIAGGGDDYELAFTLAPSRKDQILRLAETLDLPLTEIGVVNTGTRPQLKGENGDIIDIENGGWTHF